MAVSVSVLYFAALRDLAGTAEETFSVPAGAPVVVSTLLAALELEHVTLRGTLGSVRVAVNEEFVELGQQLHEGDIVALIPPVSGG